MSMIAQKRGHVPWLAAIEAISVRFTRLWTLASKVTGLAATMNLSGGQSGMGKICEEHTCGRRRLSLHFHQRHHPHAWRHWPHQSHYHRLHSNYLLRPGQIPSHPQLRYCWCSMRCWTWSHWRQDPKPQLWSLDLVSFESGIF